MKKNLQKTAKRGQITASVILGIFLVGIVLLILYIKPELSRGKPEDKVILVHRAEDVKSYIGLCVKELSEEGLIEMGKHGGYVSPKDYLLAHRSNIGYAYKDGKETFQEIGVWEKELSAYIGDNLRKMCDLGRFEDLEISESRRVKAEASFKDSVAVDVTWLVTVKKDNATFEFKDYKADVPIRMARIYEIVNSIIKNPQQARLEEYMANLENTTVNGYSHEGFQKTYVIRDYKSEIKDKDYYLFAFAIKP